MALGLFMGTVVKTVVRKSVHANNDYTWARNYKRDYIAASHAC